MNRRSSGGGGGGGGSAAGSTAYTVKFNTNGGSEISGTEVKSGAKAEKPENPKRKGYIFAGWYTDEDCTKEYSFNEPVKASVTLYAKWNEAKITMRIGSKEAEVFGEKKTNDVAPIIVNDRTMLPARFVAENLGAEVEWDDNNRQVIITRDDIKIVLTIDSAAAVVNGEEKELDSPAFIENDRTYTPVRFIAENLGAEVEWDEGESLVTITKAD